MNKLKVLSTLLVILVIAQPAWARGRGGGGKRMHSSTPIHGKVTERSYKDRMAAWEIAVAQTLAIEKYTNFANQLEGQKKWTQAECTYKYVLTLYALRDGPGSQKSVPILQHLVKLNTILDNTDKALSYQETALLLTKAQDPPNKQDILDGERSLGELYAQMSQYKDAESVLKDAVVICKAEPTLPAQSRSAVYQTYGKVLHQLHKDAEAQAIESTPDFNTPVIDNTKPAESKQGLPKQDKDSKKLVSKG